MNDAGNWDSMHIEQDIIDQVFNCINCVSEKLDLVLNHVEEVELWCIYGNHGRAAKIGTENDHVNWDYVIYKIMERQFSRMPNIKFHIPKSKIEIAEIFNSKFLLMHGDGIKSWAGIPWYGLHRAESRLRNLVDLTKDKGKLLDEIKRQYPEALKDDAKDIDVMKILNIAYQYCQTFDYMMLGHFHQPGEIETHGGKIIMNGCFAGGDNYSIKQLLTSSTPAQLFFGVHPKRKITWRYNIELE